MPPRVEEEVFAQARDAEASAEEYLVDDGWKLVEVEPEAVEVNGNGHHANGIGPTGTSRAHWQGWPKGSTTPA